MAETGLIEEAIEAARRAVAGRRVSRRTDDGERWGMVEDVDLAIAEDDGEPQLWVRWDDGDCGWTTEQWLGDHRSVYGPPDPREAVNRRRDVSDLLLASLLTDRRLRLDAPGPMGWVEDRLAAQDGRPPDPPGADPPPRPV